jgi:hypothetical protein
MAQQRDHQFILVKASKSRLGGRRGIDDFDVLDTSRKVIGHIFRAPQSPQYRPWFWIITARVPNEPTDRGYAGSRAQAMLDLEAAWTKHP